MGFLSTIEYLQYVFVQDWEQLIRQPSSIAGDGEAMGKLSAFGYVISLIPSFVPAGYDQGPYKLLCDDFGLSNIIVRGQNDLAFVGMVDLEWSYAGPAQLFASPWWLLQARLTLYDIKFDQEAPGILARFLRYLEIFKRVLKEEEEAMLGHESKKLSSLLEWSHTSGAMWLHIILSTGFNYPSSIPFSQLRDHIGAEKFPRFNLALLATAGMQELVAKKVKQLREYDDAFDKVQGLKDSQEAGDITEEESVTEAAKLCDLLGTSGTVTLGFQGCKAPAIPLDP